MMTDDRLCALDNEAGNMWLGEENLKDVIDQAREANRLRAELAALRAELAARTVVWRTDLPPAEDKCVWILFQSGRLLAETSTSLFRQWMRGRRWAYDADARRALGLGESNVPGVGPGAPGATEKED